MHVVPALTAADVRQALLTVESEFYDDTIPVAATQHRMLALTESAAHVIVTHCDKLPEHPARLLTRALTVIASRHNLAIARDLIGQALESVPPCRLAGHR